MIRRMEEVEEGDIKSPPSALRAILQKRVATNPSYWVIVSAVV